MLGKKQEQRTEENSTAIQAGGDVNLTQNNGLMFSEVKELCLLFLRDNFPALRDEAVREAQSNVEIFATKLESELAHKIGSIALEKFRDPDVQAMINDAVQASARKGVKANPSVLIDLISERASIANDDFKDIVLSEAVLVVPKLTNAQISYLSFIHFMTSCSIGGISHISELEHHSKLALTAVSLGFNLSDSQKKYIQYAGACSIASMMHVDIYDGWSNIYKDLGYKSKEEFKIDIDKYCPITKTLLEQFEENGVSGQVTLTSVGQAIAIAHLSKSIGHLDYSIWIN